MVQTILLPLPGHPGLSSYIHHSRDCPSSFLSTRRGQQLTIIQNMINENLLDQKIHHLPVDSILNIEKCNQWPLTYGLGQFSIHYILSNIRYNSAR